jgi:hypothetical protein
MPSYVRQIIEAGAKTFSIPEFLLPQFILDKNYQTKDVSAAVAKTTKADSEIVAENIVKPAVVGETILRLLLPLFQLPKLR